MDETSKAQADERTGWIHVAVLPTILFLLGIGFYAYNARGVYVEIFQDFGTELPVLTQLILRLSASPVLMLGLPSLLSLGLLWSSWKQSATNTLCLTVGCLTLGFFAAIVLHLSFTAPLVSLIQNLT